VNHRHIKLTYLLMTLEPERGSITHKSSLLTVMTER